MTRIEKWCGWPPLVALVVLLASGCDGERSPSEPLPPATPGPYVGSAACRDCHHSIYSNFAASGHPQHFQRIVNGDAPAYAWAPAIVNPVPSPPNGLAWDEVLFVVGGTTHSTIFVDLGGHQVSGPAARWDRDAGAWAEYHPGEVVPFDCGGCHVTGYNPAGEEGGPAGLVGTWAEDGVTCEACHGPGRAHLLSLAADDITIDRTIEFCLGCHQVDRDHPYPETEGLDRGLEHFGVKCVSCHDPHVSARFDRARAIRIECADCHRSGQLGKVH